MFAVRRQLSLSSLSLFKSMEQNSCIKGRKILEFLSTAREN